MPSGKVAAVDNGDGTKSLVTLTAFRDCCCPAPCLCPCAGQWFPTMEFPCEGLLGTYQIDFDFECNTCNDFLTNVPCGLDGSVTVTAINLSCGWDGTTTANIQYSGGSSGTVSVDVQLRLHRCNWEIYFIVDLGTKTETFTARKTVGDTPAGAYFMLINFLCGGDYSIAGGAVVS